MAAKTPISLLTELMTKLNQEATFDLILNEPLIPLYKFKVVACGKEAVGEGKAKKEAKQKAAEKLLLILEEGADQVDFAISSVNVPIPITQNAVGELQEFCSQNSLPMPKYNLVNSSGPPHAKIFTMQCSVGVLSEEGMARTKQDSKQQAAQKLLVLIKQDMESAKDKERLHIPSRPPLEEIFADSQEKALEILKSVRKSKIDAPTDKINISSFHMIFHHSSYPKSSTLDRIKGYSASWFHMQGNPQDLLKKILSEMSFDSELGIFRPIQSNKSHEGFFAWLTINSDPPWSFFGNGVTSDKAKENAFIEALVFLSAMAL